MRLAVLSTARLRGGVLVEGEHRFSSTQYNLPGGVARKMAAYGRKIPDGDLAVDGREDCFHITVKYGIHGNGVEAVDRIISSRRPFTVRLGKVDRFEADDHDVLFVSVTGPALHRLNKAIDDGTECTTTHPDYRPHVTIAYVKKGVAQDYVGDDDFDGIELSVDEIVFSDQDRKHTPLKLAGR